MYIYILPYKIKNQTYISQYRQLCDKIILGYWQQVKKSTLVILELHVIRPCSQIIRQNCIFTIWTNFIILILNDNWN